MNVKKTLLRSCLITVGLLLAANAFAYTPEEQEKVNSSFHKVKAKLPVEFNGQFVRISVSAKAMLGCHGEAGWLIKVAEKK